MNAHLGNPAGRLYEFLQYMRTGNQIDIATKWAGYVGLNVTGYQDAVLRPELHAHIAIMLRQPGLFEAAVEKATHTPAQAEFFLRPLPKIRSALQASGVLNSAMDSLTRQYGEGELAALEAASHQLMGTAGDPADALKEIRTLVDDLVAELNQADSLDEDLAAFIRASVQKIGDALLLYSAGGLQTLQEALSTVVGEMALRPMTASRLSQFKESSEIKKFYGLLTKVATIVTIVAGVQQIGSTISPAGTTPPPIEVIVENFNTYKVTAPGLQLEAPKSDIGDGH